MEVKIVKTRLGEYPKILKLLLNRSTKAHILVNNKFIFPIKNLFGR